MASWMLLVIPVLCTWKAGSYASSLSCGKCQWSSYEMDCPTIYDPQRFTVKIRSRKNFTDSVFQLECRARAQDINLSLIEDCNFSSIKYVEFKFCPLLNISFGELLNRIGIQPENITTLSFVYYGRRQRVSLQEWHLEGLSNLKNLEFKENNFTSIPARLFDSTPNLSLGENPWLCDCDLSDLHTFLRDPNRKVTDSSNILCHNLQELIINLTDADLCPIIEQPVVIATITCSSIFLFLFFVFGTVSIYRYKQDMKVWLFTHRICLWAVAEEEQEANKKYDAFISYSNKDEEFVNTVLVPGLESGDPKYRVCLHYRDWVPGDYIQNQIDQSIEASRRTIVILSSNFIENVWGQLEFKTAHSKALKDKTNRIIVIVFGELPPESELDEELKLYLSTRTYLQWRDTKFWDKLRYAMPHPQEFIHKKQKRKNTEKLELVKSNSKQCA
ncbi:protein toll isoform X2 [Panulirus ornatus]|uniref:protein toll isoform X2 n=1 Tax=Panulirus ornatus TaxID=150431 RepID=UPI003A8849EE